MTAAHQGDMTDGDRAGDGGPGLAASAATGSRLARLAGHLDGRLAAVMALPVLGLVLGLPLVALILHAGLGQPQSLVSEPYFRRVVAFTLVQASLSTLLSLALGWPLARALARRPRFVGRGLLIRALTVPLVLPVIVGVFGLIAILGRGGWVNSAFEAAALPVRFDLYGLGGILLAHTFYNAPLAARIMLQALEAIPQAQWRIADQLDFPGGAILRWIELPALRRVLPGLAGLIFLLTFTSFAIVLTLGGGPRFSTLEVAIYSAVRLNFDLGQAALLATLQVGLCALIFAVIQALGAPGVRLYAPLQGVQRPDARSRLGRVVDGVSLSMLALLLLAPMAAVVMAMIQGPMAEVFTAAAFWAAAGRSLLVSLGAGILALMGGWTLAATATRLRLAGAPGRARVLEQVSVLSLIVPPLVLGSGLFLLLRPVMGVLEWAIPLMILTNGLLGIPFVTWVLSGPVERLGRAHDRLSRALGMTGLHRLILVEAPRLRGSLALAFALATALALGDLGIVALFGTQATETLPLYLYRLMGAYRSDSAAVVAGVLLVMALGLLLVIETLARTRAGDRPA